MSSSKLALSRRIAEAEEATQAARRRRGGLPDTEAGLAPLILGLRGGAMFHVGAKRAEFEAARAAGAGTGDVERELSGLSAHIRGRECEAGAERLRSLVSDGVEAIARRDLRAFRRLGREAGRELRGFLAARQGEWGKDTLKLFDYPKPSAWQSLCLGGEALRASWTRLEQARRQEEERQRREQRERAADARLDEELEQRVRVLNKGLGARPTGGAGAASDSRAPANDAEGAVAAPPAEGGGDSE